MKELRLFKISGAMQMIFESDTHPQDFCGGIAANRITTKKRQQRYMESKS